MLDGSISHIPSANLPSFPAVIPSSGEEYERSPPSFPTLVTLEPPASPKGATFTRSNAIKTGPASVATKEYVKGSVFSRLSPVVDPLVDASPAATHPAEVSPIDAPPVNAPKLDAPIAPSGTCVA
ncbi:hypothetical protein NC653_021809 [Populus alba x Populus x berolinensis]|uniref:Uncharacterized protein n=1 Tax=Populus alba x Populus x berolinensis TaxID=444605 RepID=A0AAD6MNX0_9ROSI|nr:hypothetical protein NC653_021809 [Populus alba x Populus x berolinensis]